MSYYLGIGIVHVHPFMDMMAKHILSPRSNTLVKCTYIYVSRFNENGIHSYASTRYCLNLKRPSEVSSAHGEFEGTCQSGVH